MRSQRYIIPVRVFSYWRLPEPYLIFAIGLLALLIRLVFSFALYGHLASTLNESTDPDSFGRLARNWATGAGYRFASGEPLTTFRGPGYPLMLAAIYLLFGRLLPGAVVLQCLLSAVVCVVAYYICRRVFRPSIAYVAALICAVHPLLIWYAPRIRYEYLLALALMLAISFSLRLQDSRSFKDACLTGFFFGYAALVNQIVILLPLFLFVVLYLFEKREFIPIKFTATTLAVMVATITPWTIRNYEISGQIIPVNSGGIALFVEGNCQSEHYNEAPLQLTKLRIIDKKCAERLLGHRSGSTFSFEAQGIDKALTPYAMSYLLHRPWDLAAKALVQMLRFWYLSDTPAGSLFLAVIEAPLLLLALVGAWVTIRSYKGGLVLVLTILYFNLLYAAIYVEGRYSTPVIPYVAILSAVGLHSSLQLVRKAPLLH